MTVWFHNMVTFFNGKYHKHWVMLISFITLIHLNEHIVQMIQYAVFNWTPAEAKGVIGLFYPELIADERLHYFFAVVMFVGLAVLLPGFKERGWGPWCIALVIQTWHHFEHFILIYQYNAQPFWGKAVPTSVLQLWFPRLELHFGYNMAVFPFMLAAVLVYFFVKNSKTTPTTSPAT